MHFPAKSRLQPHDKPESKRLALKQTSLAKDGEMKNVLKWLGSIVGGLFGLVILGGGVLFMIGGSKLCKSYAAALAPVAIPSVAEAVVRGKNLFRPAAPDVTVTVWLGPRFLKTQLWALSRRQLGRAGCSALSRPNSAVPLSTSAARLSFFRGVRGLD